MPIRFFADINFVLSEAARFQAMGVDQIRQPLHEVLSHLRDPTTGTMIIIGSTAEQRIGDMSRYATSKSQFAGQIDPQNVAKEIKREIAKRFFLENRSSTAQEADRLVAAAIRTAAKARGTLTHLIPCHIDQNTEFTEFKFGPIKFQKTDIALRSLEPAIDSFRCADASKARVRSTLIQNALEYYRSFGWVAYVKIDDCDTAISRERASRLVQIAIDCLCLLLGATYSNHIRMGGARFSFDDRAILELDQAEKLRVSASRDWATNALGENWWTSIAQSNAKELIQAMERALELCLAPKGRAQLSRRFLDAVAWYGEAVRDSFDASRLVKYVTAIERVLITEDAKENITETLSTRAAALLARGLGKDYDSSRKKCSKIYDLRSRLVHGSQSPTVSSFNSELRSTEWYCRKILQCSLLFYDLKGLDVSVNDKKLSEMFASITPAASP